MIKNKEIKKICKNCRLFDEKNKECSIIVLYEGKKTRIPVDAEDSCFFEENYFEPNNSEETFSKEIKEVKFWVENEKGEKTNKNGIVKIEYPDGFFGKGIKEVLG